MSFSFLPYVSSLWSRVSSANERDEENERGRTRKRQRNESRVSVYSTPEATRETTMDEDTTNTTTTRRVLFTEEGESLLTPEATRETTTDEDTANMATRTTRRVPFVGSNEDGDDARVARRAWPLTKTETTRLKICAYCEAIGYARGGLKFACNAFGVNYIHFCRQKWLGRYKKQGPSGVLSSTRTRTPVVLTPNRRAAATAAIQGTEQKTSAQVALAVREATGRPLSARTARRLASSLG